MTAPALDPSPLNELGKGIFSPEKEAELLAGGYIFACKVPGTLVKTSLVCKRRLSDAVTDGDLDSPRYRGTAWAERRAANELPVLETT